MIALIGAAGAAFLLALTLLRLHAGPTLHDRALAAQSSLTKAVLLCAAIATAWGAAEGVDAAFGLAFGGFVFSAAALKVFRTGSFQAPMARAEEDS